MIGESSRYYGAVLAYLVDQLDGVLSIQRAFPDAAGFYVVNEKMPIYVKYSTSRRGPWTFNFQPDHLRRCSKLLDIFGQCIVAFVCGGDGIVALDMTELGSVISTDLGQQNAVSIRRKLNHMYSIKGSCGELDRKLSRSSLAIALRSESKE